MQSTRKFIALLMLLWLPLFSTSALAATVSMQLRQAPCHAGHESHATATASMHMHHHGEAQAAQEKHDPSCNACGVCHLAASGYLAVTGALFAAHETPRETTPYVLAFESFVSAPLVPPPLSRA